MSWASHVTCRRGDADEVAGARSKRASQKRSKSCPISNGALRRSETCSPSLKKSPAAIDRQGSVTALRDSSCTVCDTIGLWEQQVDLRDR